MEVLDKAETPPQAPSLCAPVHLPSLPFAAKILLALGTLSFAVALLPSPYKADLCITGASVTMIALLYLGQSLIVKETEYTRAIPYGRPHHSLCWFHAALQLATLGSQIDRLERSESETRRDFAKIAKKVKNKQPIEEAEIADFIDKLNGDKTFKHPYVTDEEQKRGAFSGHFGKNNHSTRLFVTDLHNLTLFSLDAISDKHSFPPFSYEDSEIPFPKELFFCFDTIAPKLEEGRYFSLKDETGVSRKYELLGCSDYITDIAHFVFRMPRDNHSHYYFSDGWRTLKTTPFSSSLTSPEFGFFTLVEEEA